MENLVESCIRLSLKVYYISCIKGLIKDYSHHWKVNNLLYAWHHAYEIYPRFLSYIARGAHISSLATDSSTSVDNSYISSSFYITLILYKLIIVYRLVFIDPDPIS